jgi:hypothetical protein
MIFALESAFFRLVADSLVVRTPADLMPVHYSNNALYALILLFGFDPRILNDLCPFGGLD